MTNAGILISCDLTSVAGKSYGAVPASTPIGPEGGHLLAGHTIDILRGLWPADVDSPE